MMVKSMNSQNTIKYSPRERVLKYLLENKSPQSIMAVSKATMLDYKNAYSLITELFPSIISKEKIGNTNIISLKLVSNPQIYSVENKRTAQFLSNHPKLKVLHRYIEEFNYPFLIVLIFGSYAKNAQTENSDIDICIISDNKEKTIQLQKKLDILSLKLEIHEFTIMEFISMIEKNKNNLGHEIAKDNIILYGAENYYNLMSKWMNKE
jgi:predicted nucleotidyltransferase